MGEQVPQVDGIVGREQEVSFTVISIVCTNLFASKN